MQPSTATVHPPDTMDEAHASPHGGAHGPTPLRRLADLLRAERGDLWVIAIYAVGVGLLSLAVPIATASLVNSISFGTMLHRWWCSPSSSSWCCASRG